MAMIFRCKADPSYVLGVRSDNCAQGGWVGLLHRNAPTLLVSWEVSDGVVRPRANPRSAGFRFAPKQSRHDSYMPGSRMFNIRWHTQHGSCVLSLTDDNCQNGAWLHLSEAGTILGQWVISGNCLRAKGNPGFVLCARRDFQGIHMWCFDGLPDHYGQWDLETAPLSTVPAALPPARPRLNSTGSVVGGILQPVISKLQSALMFNDPEDTSDPKKVVLDMRSEHFVEALQCLVMVLENFAWGASKFLESDNEKLTRLWTKAGKPSYRAWLLSETAVHAETGYQEYADDSVAMANLWVARNLSFLNELFSLLAENLDTSDAVNLAYARTLQKHHSFLQRQAFYLVYSQLPSREPLMHILEGEVQLSNADVLQEIVEMAQLTKHVTDFAFSLDREMNQKVSAEKVQFDVDTAYGRA